MRRRSLGWKWGPKWIGRGRKAEKDQRRSKGVAEGPGPPLGVGHGSGLRREAAALRRDSGAIPGGRGGAVRASSWSRGETEANSGFLDADSLQALPAPPGGRSSSGGHPDLARAAEASPRSAPPRPRPLPGVSRFLTRFPSLSGYAQGVGPRVATARSTSAAAAALIPHPAMAEDLSAATSYTEDDFYCPVCQEVLKTPVRTSACQHV